MMRMPQTTRFAIAASVTLLLAGCNFFTTPKDGPSVQLTALPRALTADEVRVSSAANQFSFTLFQRLNAAEPEKNVFVSPLSVSFSLGMAMNGASTTTLDQMRETLGFGADELATINQGYRGLIDLEAGLDKSTTFQIANSVWYRQSFPFNAAFIDQVREAFDAQVNASPFDATTVTAVNNWVSDRTNGKIPTVLERIEDAHVMFLINAIYFKGSWREQFDPKHTMSMPFNGKDGVQTVATMVRRPKTGKVRMAQSGEATIGELSYGNGAFVMTILMANQGSINDIAAGLDTARWSALVSSMHEGEYAVQLPKFRMAYERELNADLKALGMVVPFDETQADFSKMTAEQVFISFVKHKTFVDVNEEGTEAAAVTVTGMEVTSMPPCLCVDRPFVFVIRERFSGTILFMGKIVNVPQ